MHIIVVLVIKMLFKQECFSNVQRYHAITSIMEVCVVWLTDNLLLLVLEKPVYMAK